MTGWTLIWRSAAYHWRTHVAVFLGAIIGTAVLVGALAVGDCVRHSLMQIGLQRLGNINLALVADGRTFGVSLADRIGRDLDADVAAVVHLPGTMKTPDGSARANDVNVLGVESRFWSLAGASFELEFDQVILNKPLAEQLGVGPGDQVLLRTTKLVPLPRDAPLATTTDTKVAMRLTVQAIAGENQFGRFSLHANHLAPFNAFVSRQWLQQKLELPLRANVLLVSGDHLAEEADAALRRSLELADAGLQLAANGSDIELRSDRIFIEDPLAKAALNLPGASGVLTYFVNELRVGDQATPYSIVSGIEDPVLPDGVMINQWLAEDLGAKAGDRLTMSYLVVGPYRRLHELTATFTISAVIPIRDWAADPGLLPKFPGLTGAKNCRDWQPGFPIDLGRIRDTDEAYWDEYGGTPKAFLPLDLAQDLWTNRFGTLTAVRFSGLAGTKQIEQRLLEQIEPKSIGMSFDAVRQAAMDAANQAFDFGPLFLGFSFFLIVSAMLLMGLIFLFAMEQRQEQIAVLLALGFTGRSIRRLMVSEALLLAVPGALMGMILGLAYTRGILWALSTVWSEAVGGSQIKFAISGWTLVIGVGTGIILAWITIWLSMRFFTWRAPSQLLRGTDAQPISAIPNRSWISLASAILALASAGILLWLADGAGGGRQQAVVFFISAVLALVAGITACHAWIGCLGGSRQIVGLTRGCVALRCLGQRRGRSLATVTLLAMGCFLVIATGVFRQDPHAPGDLRSSGTGGFALVGRSALPIFHDLNSTTGQEAYGIDTEVLQGAAVLPMRARSGDEASCLNLNRAQRPRLVGVEARELASRHAFKFLASIDGTDKQGSWHLLGRNYNNSDVVAAIIDEPTVWALGHGLGDRIRYRDERGRPFVVEIVAVIDTSILQGNLMIAEDAYLERFPSDSGYRMMLIDVPPPRIDSLRAAMSIAMEDEGLELTHASARLAQFLVVENMYLSIFTILGGLGLALGTTGLGVVVLRNLLERRSELAILRAIGYSQKTLRRMIVGEHCLLLGLGVTCGSLAALISVAPILVGSDAWVPLTSLGVVIGGVVLVGVCCVCISVHIATRGALLTALHEQ